MTKEEQLRDELDSIEYAMRINVHSPYMSDMYKFWRNRHKEIVQCLRNSPKLNGQSSKD